MSAMPVICFRWNKASIGRQQITFVVRMVLNWLNWRRWRKIMTSLRTYWIITILTVTVIFGLAALILVCCGFGRVLVVRSIRMSIWREFKMHRRKRHQRWKSKIKSFQRWIQRRMPRQRRRRRLAQLRAQRQQRRQRRRNQRAMRSMQHLISKETAVVLALCTKEIVTSINSTGSNARIVWASYVNCHAIASKENWNESLSESFRDRRQQNVKMCEKHRKYFHNLFIYFSQQFIVLLFLFVCFFVFIEWHICMRFVIAMCDANRTWVKRVALVAVVGFRHSPYDTPKVGGTMMSKLFIELIFEIIVFDLFLAKLQI